MIFNNRKRAKKKNGIYICAIFLILSLTIEINKCIIKNNYNNKCSPIGLKQNNLFECANLNTRIIRDKTNYFTMYNTKKERSQFFFLNNIFQINENDTRNKINNLWIKKRCNLLSDYKRENIKINKNRIIPIKFLTYVEKQINDKYMEIKGICTSENSVDIQNESGIITKSYDLIKHINYDFKEECNDIMIRTGNFLEVSPNLIFKYVCVKLNKLYTNLYTYDNENTPFCSTEHTLNITEDVIKHNKFKIYSVLGLKILQLFLIKYLRSIKLCIPIEVRKRYIYDFLKIEYISKVYDEKYNLIDKNIFNNIPDKLKAKLIYLYIALYPQNVPNVLIKIFKVANYKNEDELLYKYIMKSKFTSRGGKRFHKNISKEYKKIFCIEPLIKKHPCENDILWNRFFSIIKKHNPDVVNSKKILRETYRLVFSKINFANDQIVQLFENKGFHIFNNFTPNSNDMNRENKNEEINSKDREKKKIEIKKKLKIEIKKKLKIGHERKTCVINYITNLKSFILDYIEKNKTIYHNFYDLKKNINMPKNVQYDDIISRNTNIFHFTKFNDINNSSLNGSNNPINNDPILERKSENVENLNVDHNHSASINNTAFVIKSSLLSKKKNKKNSDDNTTNEVSSPPKTDSEIYCNEIVNNTIDNILDIMIQNSGFGNIKILLGIYNSLQNNKNFKLINFKHVFDK
ncbi:conserved Plasmodium protein, unknown function [Plasmodium berghei]|uniref:Uncharacterized protein n=2 Tax=Plasmodium berghei TaxID=5821 RepID=A0A509ARX7_PLABA|nr:conserved Plasmodium protein, unknown function [Plasmodium berghei ANKA]CXJ22925.1 conserved Plasmodium protein, unknown function [Plasmodium berghei]SCM26693.1 conserved Plasmodium protein, unknown function [Plasmodium berghei]SCN28588.1 conserved Plasmodium protein, unknown function [Plasmodium berghei]SCO62776.1 conserved Plasmodium protein, unknown function [Plasmodium berghei]SCO64336.1 conserved Plasmodium protein, unknown function [Plasmodium berghei]|eukprot:XP_034424232.1 conserved Plasmodium protein, unknown function [Plasmodium berghei ANKA]